MADNIMFTRRNLLGTALAAAVLPSVSLAQNQSVPDRRPDPFRGLKLGVATYTLRKLPLDACIKAIRRVGLSYASIKDFHLPMKSTAEQRKAVADQFKAAGIALLSCGVISWPNEEAAIRQAFEYARDCGIPTIVCNPHPDSLSLAERYVKEFDMRLAIHNHGPEDKRFPSPYDAMKLIDKLDPRIGLCIDVGHTARAKVDPAEAIRKCAPRVFDIHMKDINPTFPTGRGVEQGRGVLDTKGMLQALLDIKFPHHVGIEYEKDADDVMPGLAESVGYIRGVVTTM
jgi:sugar phosphate isomerase/epimerase